MIKEFATKESLYEVFSDIKLSSENTVAITEEEAAATQEILALEVQANELNNVTELMLNIKEASQKLMDMTKTKI